MGTPTQSQPSALWDTFDVPEIERAENGDLPTVAYVTFVMLNDNYVPGALTLGHSLREQQTAAALVCLVSERVSSNARKALEAVFDLVVEIELFYVPHARRQERQDRQGIPHSTCRKYQTVRRKYQTVRHTSQQARRGFQIY